MAWTAGSVGLVSSQDVAIREDLLDILGDVSPDETPLLTLLGTSTAKSTVHQWMTYSVTRPTSVTPQPEGANWEVAAHTQPTRATNFTSIFTKAVSVSRTERKMNLAAMGDAYAFQKAQALRSLKMDMEWAVLNQPAYSSVASGSARTFQGIEGWIASLITTRASGTSFSETELNDMVADAWTTVDPDKIFDMVICTFKIKQAITGFSGNSTRYIDATDRRLVKDVLVYDSAGGSHRIFAHKDVLNTVGNTTVYGLREDMWKIAYLDKPFFQEIAKIGDADRGMWVTEFTIEAIQQKANVKRKGYHQNG